VFNESYCIGIFVIITLYDILYRQRGTAIDLATNRTTLDKKGISDEVAKKIATTSFLSWLQSKRTYINPAFLNPF